LLKLHQIYLKILVVIFVVLFIVLGIEVYFWAKKLYINELYSLHLSSDIIKQKLQNFDIYFIEFVIKISFILLVFIAIFYFFIYKTNKTLEQEVLKILSFLKSLTKKNKIEHIDSNFSEEFKKITNLLTKVAKILSKQNRQKIAYTSKLELSNIQKDEIISAISHEFKNPITIINGYSQTLLQDDIPPQIRKKFLLKIKKNGDKLTNLIDKLRLAIRLDENKQQINFSNVDVNKLLEEIIEDIKDLYDREIVLNKFPLFIQADETLMQIVFRNLIENAIKYSNDKIIINVGEDFVSVIDSGIGIKKDDLDKITDKFYRVSNNHWNNSLGLGLSIVANILKLHNFNLEIKSEIDKGSEFRVNFCYNKK
jgi:signal transduction histidine kinase